MKFNFMKMLKGLFLAGMCGVGTGEILTKIGALIAPSTPSGHMTLSIMGTVTFLVLVIWSTDEIKSPWGED